MLEVLLLARALGHLESELLKIESLVDALRRRDRAGDPDPVD